MLTKSNRARFSIISDKHLRKDESFVVQNTPSGKRAGAIRRLNPPPPTWSNVRRFQIEREQLQRREHETDSSGRRRRWQLGDQRRGRDRFHVLVRHRGLLHVVPRGQRPENVARGGAARAAPAAAAHVGAAHHVGADLRRYVPAVVVVGRERVRRVRPGQHVDHGQFGRYRVHVAAGVATDVTVPCAAAAAGRAGTGRQQAVVGGGGGRVRRLVAQRLGRGRRGTDAVVAGQVQYGSVAAHQGERDHPVRRRRRRWTAAHGGRSSRRPVAGTGRRRRVARQRAQHVQLARRLGRHQPVRRPGNVRVFRPGGRRPGGTVARQDGHRHQPHTVDVRHHAAHQRRRLRRVRDAGVRRARALGRVAAIVPPGRGPRRRRRVRAHGPAAGRRRSAGREEDVRRQGDVGRGRQSGVHVGQPETP